jgi:hypothetical protein
MSIQKLVPRPDQKKIMKKTKDQERILNPKETDNLET